MFLVLQNQVNVTDIDNKSSVSFFITKVGKKNSGVVVVQDRVIAGHAILLYLKKF